MIDKFTLFSRLQIKLLVKFENNQKIATNLFNGSNQALVEIFFSYSDFHFVGQTTKTTKQFG